MCSIVYGGLDVHKKMISACLLQQETGEIISEEVPNDRERLVRAVRRWTKWGELRLCYEASGAGFVLKRWMDDLGVCCEVIAPSLIPRMPGDRIKTNKRDARKLATMYAAGLLQVVRVPNQEEEAVRALVRLRIDLTGDMTRAKNRILKYLATLGYSYSGRTWTQAHRVWLAALGLEAVPRLIIQTHLEDLDELAERRQRVSQQIEIVAQSEPYRTQVQRLMSLRGIALTSAMLLVSEIGDAHRFGNAPALMSYMGLVPQEKSSGEHRRLGGITKAGNSRARWVLTEAAWNQRSLPGRCARLKKHWQTQPPAVVAIAKKAEKRLHDKYWKVALRKDPRTAAVAVAREMAGFIWALLCVEVP
jgi:transposase